MSGTASRVFAARLAGLAVFDPLGDQVGRVRDVVIVLGTVRTRAVGLVVEVPGRRRVFLPMTRVIAMEPDQVITTGLVNMRRFEQRASETLVLAELLDRRLRLLSVPGAGPGTVGTPTAGNGGDAATSAEVLVEDVGLEQARGREWLVTKLFVRRTSGRGTRLRRRGETMLVGIDEVTGLTSPEHQQGAVSLLAAVAELKPADLAEVLHAMTAKRRREVASALDDEKLADVLEELPEDDQVEILRSLKDERAADVLEAMQPDDAADLLSELPEATAERLLALMEPGEAVDVRRLLAYDQDTAGGIMTTEPVILPPEASIAEALASVRRAELSPAVAAAVFVCRPPLEPPTGRFIGVVHIQRLLREPPHEPVGNVVDAAVEPLPTDAKLMSVSRYLATYDLVSAPVVDPDGRLVGVATVDDVLDHLLPDDWRETEDSAAVRLGFARLRGAAGSLTAEGLVERRRANQGGWRGRP